MSPETPANDVADQMRPARPYGDVEEYDDIGVTEADPADVADQHRTVPLPEDEPWP
jgi:hypothetical protein